MARMLLLLVMLGSGCSHYRSSTFETSASMTDYKTTLTASFKINFE